ncbi:hypothetical protein AB0O34_23220 [Sphaerisporangium sp. NPDC088356]
MNGPGHSCRERFKPLCGIMGSMTRVCLVCMGNICRSPMAEGGAAAGAG